MRTARASLASMTAILRPLPPRSPRRKDLVGEHLAHQLRVGAEAGRGRDQRRATTASILPGGIGGARIVPGED